MTASTRQRLKRWLVRLCMAFIVGFVLLNVLAARQAYAMMHFQSGSARTGTPETLSGFHKIGVLFWGIDLPHPHAETNVSVLGPNARALQIAGDGHVKLGAWYCPGPTNAPLVILFHGYGSEKSGTLSEARVFIDLGYAVLLVDFRGSGDSSESYTTIGYIEADDVASTVRYARQNFPSSKIVLYGQSMGAAAVLRAVGVCGVKPDAIIIEAVFDTLLNTVRHRFEAMKTPSFPGAELLIFWGGLEAGFNAFKHNPVDYAGNITCPALFLHGTADPRAHIEEARRVYEAIAGTKQFKEFPGVGHAAALTKFPNEYRQAVSDFLVQALDQPHAANAK